MTKSNCNSGFHTDFKSSVHLSLQGKGGVGKSLIASILCQHFIRRGLQVRAVDADPINQTLAQYKLLNATKLELLQDGTIDQRAFDRLIEQVLTQPGTYVIDTGASTFIPLWHYLLENDALQFLKEQGHSVFVHTVITGGQSLLDTLSGFNQLAESTREKNLIVWLNEYFGPVKQDGASFADMAVYARHREKLLGSVAFVRRNQDTYGRDIEQMISQKLSFQEAVASDQFTIMAKQRLKVVEQDLYSQLYKVWPESSAVGSRD